MRTVGWVRAALVLVSLAPAAEAQSPAPSLQPVVVHPIRQLRDRVVFDSVHRQVTYVGDEGQVWRMHPAGWTLAPGSTDQPAPQGGGYPVFDEAGRRLLLFQPNGLWIWQGGRWSRFAGSGPQPTAFGVATYDGAAGRTLVTGNGGFWELSGSTWRMFAPYPAWARYWQMAYDEFRGVLVLVDPIVGDVCEWDGVQWQVIAAPFPSFPTTNFDIATVVYDSLRHRVVVGGSCRQWSSWACAEWDGVQWVMGWASTVSGFGTWRCGHSAWFDRAAGLMIFCGGFETISSLQPITDFSSWDGSVLRDHGVFPAPIQVSYWFHDPRSRQNVVAEDQTCLAVCIMNTWLLAASNHSWRRMPEQAPRGRLPCAYDTIRNEPLVWSPGQLQAWTGSLWQPRGAAGPSYGEDASMAFDPIRGELVLRSEATSVWLWNGATWTQRATPFGPTARQRAAMAFDPVAGRCVLFGGHNAVGTWRNDTWTWDGAQWAQVAGTAPPVLAEPSLQFDPVQQRMLLLGQRQGSEWWQRDSAGWTFVDRSSVSYRLLLWDDARRVMAMLRCDAQGEADAVVEWSPAPAQVKPFGSGCTPSTPRLEALARPRLGDPRFGLQVDATPGTPVGFEIGVARAPTPRGPCALRIAGTVGQALAIADQQGLATLALPLPPLPVLQGIEVFAQAALLSAAAGHPEFTYGLWLLCGD